MALRFISANDEPLEQPPQPVDETNNNPKNNQQNLRMELGLREQVFAIGLSTSKSARSSARKN
jgi:hypothetical protein